jgi:hypothetical protein
MLGVRNAELELRKVVRLGSNSGSLTIESVMIEKNENQ